MIDAPDQTPRGGGRLHTTASSTGRSPSSYLPACKTLPNADVRFATVDGRPLQAIRSRPDGTLPLTSFSDIGPDKQVILTAFDGQQADSQIVTTIHAKEK